MGYGEFFSAWAWYTDKLVINLVGQWYIILVTANTSHQGRYGGANYLIITYFRTPVICVHNSSKCMSHSSPVTRGRFWSPLEWAECLQRLPDVLPLEVVWNGTHLRSVLLCRSCKNFQLSLPTVFTRTGRECVNWLPWLVLALRLGCFSRYHLSSLFWNERDLSFFPSPWSDTPRITSMTGFTLLYMWAKPVTYQLWIRHR